MLVHGKKIKRQTARKEEAEKDSTTERIESELL
jgi:hypothetical protein